MRSCMIGNAGEIRLFLGQGVGQHAMTLRLNGCRHAELHHFPVEQACRRLLHSC